MILKTEKNVQEILLLGIETHVYFSTLIIRQKSLSSLIFDILLMIARISLIHILLNPCFESAYFAVQRLLLLLLDQLNGQLKWFRPRDP